MNVENEQQLICNYMEAIFIPLCPVSFGPPLFLSFAPSLPPRILLLELIQDRAPSIGECVEKVNSMRFRFEKKDVFRLRVRFLTRAHKPFLFKRNIITYFIYLQLRAQCETHREATGKIND